MRVTRVEMLLWHKDPAEVAKMLHWMTTVDEKFLFDDDRCLNYGLYMLIVSWYRENIRIDKRCRNSSFIDFNFTLKTYVYPHALALILRHSGWKIKARYIEAWIDGNPEWKDIRVSGEWKYDYDPLFPLWDARADRARQESGRSPRG